MAVLSLAFTSCFKESQYSITYIGEETDVANVTLFEYDYAYNLVAQREVKLIKPNNIYEITSSDLADYVVVGVEGIIYGKISIASINRIAFEPIVRVYVLVPFISVTRYVVYI